MRSMIQNRVYMVLIPSFFCVVLMGSRRIRVTVRHGAKQDSRRIPVP